jgi:hypothetical protein
MNSSRLQFYSIENKCSVQQRQQRNYTPVTCPYLLVSMVISEGRGEGKKEYKFKSPQFEFYT